MELNLKKFDLKKAVKVLGSLLLVDLVYLNILLPIGLSAKQIYLVAESVVAISHKKNIDLNNISSKEFDEICNLAIKRVIAVFKENGFRLVPHALCASSEQIVVRRRSLSALVQQENPQQLLDAQVSSIFTNGISLKNLVVDNWNRFVEIAKNIVHSPASLKLYVATKCAFLALNVTAVNATFIRYAVWLTASTLQLFFIPGTFQSKLPVIVGSLMRDCHFQLLDLVFTPCVKCVKYIAPGLTQISDIGFIKNYVKPLIDGGLSFYSEYMGRLRWFLKRNDVTKLPYNTLETVVSNWRLIYAGFIYHQFHFFNQKLVLVSEYGNKLISSVGLYYGGVGFPLYRPAQKLLTGAETRYGRINENITKLLLRNRWWKSDLKRTLKLIKQKSPADRRAFEIYFGDRWWQADDLNLAGKTRAWFGKIIKGIFTKPFRS